MTRRRAVRAAGVLVLVLALAACAAGPNTAAVVDAPHVAGFWLGLWHGAISPITFVVSLFSSGVNIYEVHNNGGWYNFGFMLGASAALSGAGRSSAAASYRTTGRGRGRGSFIDSILAATDAFYAEVLQDLKAWSATPPKMRPASPEDADAEPTRPASLGSTDFSSQDGPAAAGTTDDAGAGATESEPAPAPAPLTQQPGRQVDEPLVGDDGAQERAEIGKEVTAAGLAN